MMLRMPTWEPTGCQRVMDEDEAERDDTGHLRSQAD
jgi:hypothetical protein